MLHIWWIQLDLCNAECCSQCNISSLFCYSSESVFFRCGLVGFNSGLVHLSSSCKVTHCGKHQHTGLCYLPLLSCSTSSLSVFAGLLFILEFLNYFTAYHFNKHKMRTEQLVVFGKLLDVISVWSSHDWIVFKVERVMCFTVRVLSSQVCWCVKLQRVYQINGWI